jgi:hypothetical protein
MSTVRTGENGQTFTYAIKMPFELWSLLAYSSSYSYTFTYTCFVVWPPTSPVKRTKTAALYLLQRGSHNTTVCTRVVFHVLLFGAGIFAYSLLLLLILIN